ncbi:transcription termination factor 2 [Verticillium dahliae VdLs.17]|uniref:Transcription termination factor 2 n=1 Tax=Verticillium dahliae (strain VdLs.17 / ATCC MYA-4575 / FGSC 10137) TaxID=498257 RepID=G2XG05_VERDV|nr:transcription termination factor 2 [Verticillium dahliae VdLs.17]EGY18824.1 transcription termination factor 2 [Verticillium dahliae VdLs.17]
MASANRHNGQAAAVQDPSWNNQTAPAPQAWNAQALLAPRSKQAVPSPAHGYPQRSYPVANQFAGAQHNGGMVFEFTGPSDMSNDSLPSSVPSTSSTPATDGRSTPNGQVQGLGGMIERMNGVQDRAYAPAIKRRKVDTPEADAEMTGKKGMTSGGSGVLGAYLKEKREEAQQNGTARPTHTVDLTLVDDDDVKVIEHPDNEEVCYGMLQGKVLCSIVPSAKPGAKSLFGDNWFPPAKVVAKRITGDRSKRISLYDFTREIIGNIDEMTAGALTPLMDANMQIRTDCRIPARKKQPGEEPRSRVSKLYPLELVIYGPKKWAKPVADHFKKNSMVLRHPNRVDKGIKYVNYQVVTTEPAAPRPQANGRNLPNNFVPGMAIAQRTVEEMRSDVMGVFDQMGKNNDVPELEPSDLIVTPLLKHQKQGLYFMTNKEADATWEQRTTDSFYKARISSTGQRVFLNVVTGLNERQLPPQTRGGILADMMGLGKTLSILSLVCHTLTEAQTWAQSPLIQPEEPPQKPSSMSAALNTLGLTKLKRNAKTTLLVCPLTTIFNWEEQIKQHIQPGKFSYYVYHGATRIRDVEQLAQYDLVITTYGSISTELGLRNKRKPGKYPMEEIGWFRIVLDEAHMIRETSTQQFKAIVRLQANRRWAVTGTPVQNRLEDLAALLAFLRLKPFDDRNRFNRFIVDPFKACDPEIVPKLRIMVDSITMRRLKDKIDLPPRTDHVIKLDMTMEERQVYDLFEKNAQDRVQVLSANAESSKGALGGQTYIHILRSILRLRLLCAHGADLLNPDDMQALEGMTADMAIDLDSDDENSNKPALSERQAYEMFELMLNTNADKCSQCTKKLGASDGASIESEGQEEILGYMTQCYHVICGPCFKKVKELAKEQPGQCLFCPNQVDMQYIALKRARANVEHDGHIKAKAANNGKRTFDRYNGPHTKTKALLEDLLKSEAETAANPTLPPFKSVVFSSWTTHLDLIEMALDSVGITYSRLDGKMSRNARTKAMDEFRDNPSIHVILVSIMAGSLGLNLTSGNNVYVMEPQYNPAAEAQAVDRVHRLGQKRPVQTVRYIMRNSFEEKMIELQDKKKKLASLSMDGKGKALDRGDAARQKLMDLRSLFK